MYISVLAQLRSCSDQRLKLDHFLQSPLPCILWDRMSHGTWSSIFLLECLDSELPCFPPRAGVIDTYLNFQFLCGYWGCKFISLKYLWNKHLITDLSSHPTFPNTSNFKTINSKIDCIVYKVLKIVELIFLCFLKISVKSMRITRHSIKKVRNK